MWQQMIDITKIAVALEIANIQFAIEDEVVWRY